MDSSCLDNVHQSNSLVYIAGNAANKYLNKHDCNYCRRLLVNDSSVFEGEESHVFMNYKAYSHLPGNFGGLVFPSDSFLCYLKLCEALFANLFEHVKHTRGITAID